MGSLGRFQCSHCGYYFLLDTHNFVWTDEFVVECMTKNMLSAVNIDCFILFCNGSCENISLIKQFWGEIKQTFKKQNVILQERLIFF